MRVSGNTNIKFHTAAHQNNSAGKSLQAELSSDMRSASYNPTNSHRTLCAFTLLELLVALAVFSLICILLSSMTGESLRLLRLSSSQSQVFQNARGALETMSASLTAATMNPFWDYDNANTPTRYLRRSWLAFVSGRATSILGSGYDPGQCVFFLAPGGLLADSSNRRLNQTLNTYGFFIEYRDANQVAPSFMNLPQRKRYLLMKTQSSGESMQLFSTRMGNPADNAWITATLPDARILAENIVMLVIRPKASDGSDLAGASYAFDTRVGETSNPQPATANQLPPFLEITLVAVSEESMKRKNPELGFVFSSSELAGLFNQPSSFNQDLEAFQKILVQNQLEFRVFQQQIALPNSKWSQ